MVQPVLRIKMILCKKLADVYPTKQIPSNALTDTGNLVENYHSAD